MTLTALEQQCIDDFRAGRPPENVRADVSSEFAWIRFGLRETLDAGAAVRELRAGSLAGAVCYKPDGSPYTELERAIEARIRNRLQAFCPGGVFVGEETGGDLAAEGYTLAVDPIDGTWSMVNRSETCTTTLAFFERGEIFVAMVQNPVTGELAYAGRQTSARLVQLSLYGEGDVGSSLPCDRARAEGLLVNLQPQRDGARAAAALFSAWRDGDIGMLKLTGGSPSWSLLEAAKGRFVYVNLWTPRPADPFDLAAGVLLVRAAGGDVTDLLGEPIDPGAHSGPFVAAVDAQERARAAELVREAVG